MSRGPIPDLPRDRPSVASLRPFVESIYARSPSGCCLHIALDDGNLNDHHLTFCWEVANERGHDDCRTVATAMLKMSSTQRRKVQDLG